MESRDIERLVSEKTSDLASRSDAELQAARATLCAHTYDLAAEGWRRWPSLHAAVVDAMSGKPSPALAGFAIEDDGSAEWQRVIDLVVLLLAIADDEPPLEVLHTGMLAHLDGTFAIVANRRAEQLARPISETEALAVVDDDPEWQRERAFVLGL